MKVFYDIHIHSTLSACGDELQTPNNILNMAMLKGLNMIAITDHNTLKHLPTFEKIIGSYNFLFLYGCEVTVKEGFHVLTYFENLEEAMKFDKVLEVINTKQPHDNKKYGQQLIYDEYDMPLQEIEYLLNYPLDITFSQLIKVVREFQGIVIPAHINRVSSGILGVYQNLQPFDIDGIEIYNKENIEQTLMENTSIKKIPKLYNSDAHSLEMINERINFIELEELTFQGLRKYLEKKHE